jgi:hypothetical protein
LLFCLHPLRFSFIARELIHFPVENLPTFCAAPFGVIFRRIACVPQCMGARECEWRTSCPYARMFDRSAGASGPSGLADWPRPFVCRATHLDGRTAHAGESFHFKLNLFDIHSPAVAYLVLAFGQLAREGLGPQLSRVELASVSQRDAQGEPVGTIFRRQVAPDAAKRATG